MPSNFKPNILLGICRYFEFVPYFISYGLKVPLFKWGKTTEAFLTQYTI